MKTNLKKFAALILAVLFVCCLAACGGEQQKVSVIGISQYGEHESLDNCRLGFLQGLKDAGLTEGVDYVIDYQNAGFDDNIVKQIAESFSANNVALMCGIATPSAMACYAAAENKNIPVIFTAITDPVQAKLDTGNVTGTSDKLAVEGQLELIRAMQPDASSESSSRISARGRSLPGALVRAGREDLIGHGADCLVQPDREYLISRRAAGQGGPDPKLTGKPRPGARRGKPGRKKR